MATHAACMRAPACGLRATALPQARVRVGLPLPSRAAPKRRVVVRAAASAEDGKLEVTAPRVVTATAWAGFMAYAVFVAPKSSPDVDAALVETLISTPFTGEANRIFESLFNALGIMPAVYASLLLPGGKDQKPLPAVPFVAGSFVLGYFSLGPYLTAREVREEPITRSELGWVTRNVLEAKWNAALLVTFAAYLAYNVGANYDATQVADFWSLWNSVSLVNVSSVDLCVLSAMVYFPMVEDMRRRGWEDKTSLAPAFCALPVIGPALYILCRPALED